MLERLGRSIERARGDLLRSVAAAPLVGPVVRRRELRIAARAVVAIALAFLLATLVPAATLAISPIVLGVPHVASSIRYLVVRQTLPRGWVVLLAAGAAAIGVLRICEQYGPDPHAMARGEVAIGCGLAIAAACFAGARADTRPRLVLVLPLLLALGGLLVLHPIAARLAFVHVHNLGAVAIWALVMQRGRARLPALLLLGALALLVAAPITPWQARALGVDVESVGRWLVPGAAAAVSVRLVLAHVFTDSVHYAFWLGIIPEETLRSEGTLTFAMTWRALRRDFGAAGLGLVCALTGTFLVLGALGLTRARNVYFAVAGFHGYVEGAMLVYLLVVRGDETGQGCARPCAIEHRS